MSRSLFQTPVQLGGVGKVVEIDESKWGHKRKFNRNRLPQQSAWIFGLIERGSGKVRLITVELHSADVLLPNVQNQVLPALPSCLISGQPTTA